jgi:Zn-dependent peptidase ImmA (M78 family)
MTKADERAADLLAKANARTAPIDVEGLAREAGASVIRQRYERGDISGMLLREPGRVIIGVNSAHAPVRQRFTVAHELGHLELHRGRALIMDVPVRVNFRDHTSSLASDREEMEANRFAASLLMPADLVVALARKSKVHDVDGLIADLAKRFRVSSEAMSYRLVNLGMLS